MHNKKGLAAGAVLPAILGVIVLTLLFLQTSGAINIKFWKLSPARNLAGNWEGRATWHDNIGSPACYFEGIFRFKFKQNGNQLQGEWWLTQTKLTETIQNACGSWPAGENYMGELSGTLEGTRMQFSALSSGMNFEATFTTDQLKGNFILNKEFGLIGEFSAFRKS